jgi:hypothetical protein
MRRWRARHLLTTWIAYWALLALFALGPAALAFQRVSAKPHGKLSVSAGFENDDLYLTVSDAAATAWHGTIPFFAAVLWVVLPPLLLWILWVALRPRPEEVRVRG